MRYKFRADSWNKDTLQTVKVFNVRSYKTNATLANTAGIVFLYTNKVPLITKAANTVIDDSLVASVTYPSAELFNWSVPDYETIDTANNVLKYADDIHTLTYNQNLKSNNNIYIETTDVSTDTNMTPFNFLNGSSVIDEELYLFIGMTDPEVEITVEEVSVVPAPTKVSFNVVSPPANANNVHVFYNPIYINAELGAASPVNKEFPFSESYHDTYGGGFNVPILSTYPGVPLSLFNQFYKIEADDIAAEIYGFAYDRAFDIRFLPGLNANVANVIFFNSGGITPGETSTIKESLLVKYDSFTNIINPSPPISGGPALTPVTAIVENVEIGHEPNYHSRII